MTDQLPRLAAALADRYRIERELGQGGMATVYLAEDLKHARNVAVKVLRPELAAVIGADRFLSEIRTTANLQHPHILPLHDSGEADGFLFYVMPLVEGETVRDRLNREKQLPVDDAVRIATEVAAALDYAHRHGVIHRDIKPENILLHDGSALVADFGIALAASTAGQDRMTETGMSLGTPHYMSPEQAMGERELTARSDVYALGCVLYEMLLGEPPFTGPTVQSIVAKVMSEKPAPLTARRDRIPAQLEDAVLTALEKLPADRFVSAAAFAHALTDPSAVTSSYASRRASAPAGGRSPMVRGVILTVAVVVIGVIAFGLGRRGGTPDAGARPTSLAVLPFENIGGDPQNEYFSDGVTEDIIAQVSQIAGLKVISRTSTTKFKDGGTSIREIGQQLGVTSVLEGSVRRQGNRIRIVAQLIDARTDEHLWASTYDRELEDIFAIQTDVADNIASALGSMLTTGGGAASVPTTNLEAYEIYLNGRLLIAQRTSDALHTAVERFEAALALDPKFAAAYGGLAEAWMLLPIYSSEPAIDAAAKVERYADSALALDSRLSVAYAARAFDRAFIGWQFAEGERDLKEAIRLNPNFASAHQWLGSVLMVQGKADEALANFRQAVVLDPFSNINATDLAMNLFTAGRFPEAEAQFQQVMTRDPQFAPAFQRAGWLYGTQGNDSAAAEVLEQWNLLQGRPLVPPGTIRTAYAAGGRDSMYSLLVAPGVRGRAPIFDLASWYVYLGKDAEALDVLEEAADRRDPFLGAGLRFPMWGPLKEEPRYQALLKRVYGDD